MLTVDLGELLRKGRLTIEGTVPSGDPLLEFPEIVLPGGLNVRLVVSPAGRDVLARGRLSGEAELECRRCLKSLRGQFDEDVTLLYRSGVSATEAEAEEVYALPDRARQIELGPAVREHVILAVPQYPLCDPSCRGLCPQCGADLNRGPCGCVNRAADARWVALRKHSD